MDIAISRPAAPLHRCPPVAPPPASRAPGAEPSAWDRHALALVDGLALHAGATVLEVGCGSGGAALAAACAVGPAGRVVGVDLEEPLLRRARERARLLGLEQIDFLRADFARLPFPDGAFDAVLCTFDFGPGLPARLRELWRLVAPGGSLAVTVWSPQAFEPLDPEERAQMRSMSTTPGLTQALHATGAWLVEVELAADLAIGRAHKAA